MRITLPPDVADIINRLEENGYEAYAVGGCVRDSLLGREPNDWDITTSALPMQVKELFRRTVDTGIQHGTVTVLLHHIGYEVTTYRIDGKYEDARHPSEVTFTPDLLEDLRRRDFTINAMAYNDRQGLVDAYGGQEDLENGIIRAVGDPRRRFSEDALRLMRAVRFASQLGYEIEDETKKAIAELAPTLQKISAERIQTELVKLVTSPHPEYMRLLYETGITRVILPWFDRMMETEQNNPHHFLNVGKHTILSMQEIRADKVLRLAMLFHDCGKPDCRTTDENGIDHFHGHPDRSREIAHKVLRELKFDNDTIEKVSKLAGFHDMKVIPQPKYVRRALRKTGAELFALLLDVKQADLLAQSDYLRAEKQAELAELKKAFDYVTAQGQCFQIRDLAVTGSDLIALGMQPGPGLGKCLAALLEDVIENPEHNEKEFLLQLAKERIF